MKANTKAILILLIVPMLFVLVIVGYELNARAAEARFVDAYRQGHDAGEMYAVDKICDDDTEVIISSTSRYDDDDITNHTKRYDKNNVALYCGEILIEQGRNRFTNWQIDECIQCGMYVQTIGDCAEHDEIYEQEKEPTE